MSGYEFKMADDESHATVMIAGQPVGTVQNNPEYLGGGLNFSRDSSIHKGPIPEVGVKFWDAFYEWADSLAAPTAEGEPK